MPNCADRRFGPVDEAALAKAVGEHQLHGGDEAGGAVADDQQRSPRAPDDHAVEEAAPSVGGLRRARLQARQHRAALGDQPQGPARLGPGAVVVRE